MSISNRFHDEPHFLIADLIQTEFFGDVLFDVYLMIGLELARDDATLLQTDKKGELITRIRVAFEKIEVAVHENAIYIEQGCSLEQRDQCAQAAEEDEQEGPADNAFLFEIGGRGTIVAVEVERPAINVTQPIGSEVAALPF